MKSVLETIGKGFCGIGKVSLWIAIFVWAIAVTAAKIFFVLFLTLARMVLILISAVEPEGKVRKALLRRRFSCYKVT